MTNQEIIDHDNEALISGINSMFIQLAKMLILAQKRGLDIKVVEIKDHGFSNR